MRNTLEGQTCGVEPIKDVPSESPEEESLEERRKRVFSLSGDQVKELRYRRLSALSFIVVMLVFGIPLWWQTTSTYRVAFRSFSSHQQITIPVSITLSCWNQSLFPSLDSLSDSLLERLQDTQRIERLNLNFTVRTAQLDSREQTTKRLQDHGRFEVHVALVSDEEWFYAGTHTHLAGSGWTFVKYSADQDSVAQRAASAITDVLLDMAHLSIIIRRDLKKTMQPLQVDTLPPSQQKRLVWDSAAQSAHYIVQVMFAHAGGSVGLEPKLVLDNIRRYATSIDGITQLLVSSEHLWDFDMAAWLNKDVQDRPTLSMDHISNIIVQTDQETSTVESSYPLLKLLIIDHKEPIVLLDQMGDDSKGVVVASWGAVVGNGRDVSASAISALRVLLGLDTELPPGTSKDPSPVAAWELNRLKLRSFVDFSMNAMSSVRAIHTLIDHIDNVVINDHVAQCADRAVERIEYALELAQRTGRLDMRSVTDGHGLAQKAVNDQTLLALLYFPSDQKFAIYLPLFLPTLLPLFGSMLTLFKHWRNKDE